MHEVPPLLYGLPFPGQYMALAVPAPPAKRSLPPISMDQTAKMLDIISTNFDLYANYSVNDEEMKRAWIYLAQQLNALGSAENARFWQGWRGCWLRMKSRVLQKVTKIETRHLYPEGGKWKISFRPHQARILRLLEANGICNLPSDLASNSAQGYEATTFPRNTAHTMHPAFLNDSDNASLEYPRSAARGVFTDDDTYSPNGTAPTF
ncbi:hypothetical protein DMENIID0001_027560 [Sergentomyia squamirostris]